jgi:glyoxylase-like metal-dependent hydrolase (beta-lactamase superfamily II)
MSLTREDVSEGVTVFRGRYPVAGIGVTSTVISSGDQAFVFDTLLYPEDTEELLRSMSSMGLNPVGLINTHWHLDHTAGNQIFFQTKRIISHSLCIDLMHTDLPAQIEYLNKNLEEEDKVRPVYPNEIIEDKSTLTVGDREIHLLHAPGHTPDSILGYLEEERIVIAGDTVMELPYLWYGDSQGLIDSLKRLKPIVIGKKIIQGHGVLCGSEKVDSDIGYIESAKRLAANCIKSGKTLKEATLEIPLDRCLPNHRFDKMPKAYNDIHLENLEKLYKEMAARTG